MKKLFISQPFSEKTKSQVMKERTQALVDLQEIFHIPVDDYQVINNYDHPEIPEGSGRLMHLGRSIQQMQDADLVFFAKGWSTAKGCRIERDICLEYEIPFLCE